MNESHLRRFGTDLRSLDTGAGRGEYPDVERDIDLRAALGFLRRQWRLIAACVVTIVALTALWTFSLTPKYTAEALVLVESGRGDLLDSNNNLNTGPTDSSRVDSAVEIASSTATLLRVIRDQRLLEDPEFGVALGFRAWLTTVLRSTPAQVPTGQEAVQIVLDNLNSALNVSRRGLTDLIAIAVESADPNRAAELANALATAYIEDQVDAKISAALAARDVLRRRIALATDAVSAAEEAIDSFVFDNADRIAEEGARPEIIDFRQEIARLEEQRAATNRLVSLVEERLRERDWDSLRDSLESDAVRALDQQRRQIEQRLASLEDDAAEVDLRAELSRLEAELGDATRLEVSSMRKSLTEAQGQIADIRTSIRNSALTADLPTDMLTTVYSLQQESSVARNQYQVLLSRLRDVEAQAELQLADARLVSPAVAPSEKSFPRVTLILGAASLFSLAFGVGLAWLRENYIGGFVSDRQVESVLRLEVASSVPRYKGVSEGSAAASVRSPADAVAIAPISMFSESVRRIRASIGQRTPLSRGLAAERDKGSVIMVCSAVPGEGKSTLALALGRSYALAGKKTVIVDCDLRRPSIHVHLGLTPSSGLQDFISGDLDDVQGISGIFAKDPLTDLTVIMGARSSATPTDHLIISAAFERLVASAAQNFEVVVLDSPPIGPVVDGLYLARHADVIALVIRWASTAQDDVRSACQALYGAKRQTTPLLAVLNGVDIGRSAYDRRYAGYFEEA